MDGHPQTKGFLLHDRLQATVTIRNGSSALVSLGVALKKSQLKSNECWYELCNVNCSALRTKALQCGGKKQKRMRLLKPRRRQMELRLI